MYIFLWWNFGLAYSKLVTAFVFTMLFPELSLVQSGLEGCRAINFYCVTHLSVASVYFILMHPDYIILQTDNFAHSDFITNQMLIPMICYQGQDILLGIVTKRASIRIDIVHHITTIATALLAMTPIASEHLYSVFFCGFMEMSTIPLQICRILEDHPKIAKSYPLLEKPNKLLFVFLFISIRVFMMPLVTWSYFEHAQYDFLHTREWILLCASLIMIGLHIVWGFQLGLLVRNSCFRSYA